jgi:hypothetical protein
VHDAPGTDEIPLLGSPEWLCAPHEVKIAALAGAHMPVIFETSPDVIAARLSAELLAHALIMSEAANAVSAAEDWASNAARHLRAQRAAAARTEPYEAAS